MAPGRARVAPAPYTTLFRSAAAPPSRPSRPPEPVPPEPVRDPVSWSSSPPSPPCAAPAWRDGGTEPPAVPVRPPSTWRSEEHTSELQSRQKLVCRLLLEKKK